MKFFRLESELIIMFSTRCPSTYTISSISRPWIRNLGEHTKLSWNCLTCNSLRTAKSQNFFLLFADADVYCNYYTHTICGIWMQRNRIKNWIKNKVSWLFRKPFPIVAFAVKLKCQVYENTDTESSVSWMNCWLAQLICFSFFANSFLSIVSDYVNEFLF